MSNGNFWKCNGTRPSLHRDLEGDGVGLDDVAADDPVGDAEAPLEVGDVHEVDRQRAPPAGRGRGHEEEDGGKAKHDGDQVRYDVAKSLNLYWCIPPGRKRNLCSRFVLHVHKWGWRMSRVTRDLDLNGRGTFYSKAGHFNNDVLVIMQGQRT